jgi:uncharacterized protein (TIGR03435 family)
MRLRSNVHRTASTIVHLLAAWTISGAIASAQVVASSSLPADPPYVPTFTFDVASIRENKPTISYTMTIQSPLHVSSFLVTSFSARDLITLAYRISWFQLSGGPDWINTARFDVQAKADPSVDETMKKLTGNQAILEKKHMLQVLLADRFNLKIHEETKVLPSFALVVLKGGPKFHLTKIEATAPDQTRPPPLYQRGDGARGYEFIAEGATMPSLAQILEGQFQTPILDKTGLAGKYDFTLQYHGTETDDSTDDGKIWPPLRRAIQEQLGLKLEPTKAPGTIFVIDHIEKPSEN